MLEMMSNVNGVVGATYEDMERPQSAQQRAEMVAQYVVTFAKRSEQYFDQSRRRLPELYNVYRNISRGFDHPFRNNVSTNQIFATIEADVARKASALLAGAPITFEGTPISGGASYARKQQALYYQQDREDEGFIKNYMNLKAAALYGTGVQRRGWCYSLRQGAKFQMLRSPVDGKMYRIGQASQEVDFDGPTKENVDLLDTFFEPGQNRVRDMRRLATRYWLDLDAVEAMYASGELTNFAEFVRLKQTGAVSSDMYENMRQLRGIDAVSGSPKDYDPYAKPVELLDFIGFVPKELAQDGITFRRIIIANRMFVLLDEPFPWAHGQLDYVVTTYSPFMDPHFIYAPGKVEVAIALQRAQNKFINQALDVADLAISPPTFINEDLLVDPRGMQIKAGKIIKVRGNPGEGILPYSFPLQGASFGIDASSLLGTMIQKGTGIIDDVGQGLPSNPRETARGVLARSEAAGTRSNAEIQLAEEGWLCPDADAVMELNRQFLTDSRQAELLGDMAMMDPVTGGTNQFPAGSVVQINPEDVAVRLRARAVGTSTRLSKSMAQQNMLLVMQGAFQAAGMGGPAVLAQMNMLGWIRLMAKTFEMGSEVNELVVQDPKAYAAQLALMIMASQKGGPEAAMGAAPGASGEMSSPIAGGAEGGQFQTTENPGAQLSGTLGGGLAG